MKAEVEIGQDGARLTVRIPMQIRKRGGKKVVMAPEGAAFLASRDRPDTTLVKAIARAYRWQRMLEQGTYSLRDLAAAEHISPTYVSRLLRLSLLAPEIVEAVLDGHATEASCQDWLSRPIIENWVEQTISLVGRASAERFKAGNVSLRNQS